MRHHLQPIKAVKAIGPVVYTATATAVSRIIAMVVLFWMQGAPGEWTELRTVPVEFDVELPANLFTLSKLRNPPE